MGPRGVSGKAVRVASDKDLRDNLRSAIDDLRNAADRIQKGPSHKGRNLLLVSGIAIGIFLFNPDDRRRRAPVAEGKRVRRRGRVRLPGELWLVAARL